MTRMIPFGQQEVAQRELRRLNLLNCWDLSMKRRTTAQPEMVNAMVIKSMRRETISSEGPKDYV